MFPTFRTAISARQLNSEDVLSFILEAIEEYLRAIAPTPCGRTSADRPRPPVVLANRAGSRGFDESWGE
jgi:hypothetical protein